MSRNKNLITREIRVGKNAAEEDAELLQACFVDHPALADAIDTDSNGSIIAGRTGSGKSAIISYIRRTQGAASSISPSDMAMNYIANSDVLRFLNDIGADLNLFFQAIWKHVLLIEYIRLRYQIGNEEKSAHWYTQLWNAWNSDKSKKRALDYLKKYSSSFWISMDESVRQVTQTYEQNILAELGVDIEKFASKAGYGANLSNQNKSEFVARVRKIINSDQLQDQSKVISLLADGDQVQKSHYILIDQLDERWLDDNLKYRMINSLVEALQKFRPIRNLKIIVALRTDVIERSMQENKDSSFQREKFRDYIININWDEGQLKELINKRIAYTFRRKYEPQRQVLFEDVFEKNIKNEKPFKYLADRTLLRPRDIIAFTNECFISADGRTEVAPTDVYDAEGNYSQYRYEALMDEWRVAFPHLDAMVGILRGKATNLRLSDFGEEEIDNAAVAMLSKGAVSLDPLTQAAQFHFDTNTDHSRSAFMREGCAVLYRVGAIGLKLASDEPVRYSHLHRPIISASAIPVDAGIRVVKMLHNFLRINDGRRT